MAAAIGGEINASEEARHPADVTTQRWTTAIVRQRILDMITRLAARQVLLGQYIRVPLSLRKRCAIDELCPKPSRAPVQTRHFAAKSEADIKIEELQEL